MIGLLQNMINCKYLILVNVNTLNLLLCKQVKSLYIGRQMGKRLLM